MTVSYFARPLLTLGRHMPVSDLTLPVSKRLPNTLRRSFYFAALPTICLLVYWALGETGLIIFALTAPIFFALYCGSKPYAQQAETGQADGLAAAQEQLETCINDMLFSARSVEHLRCSVSRLMTLRMSHTDLDPRSFTRFKIACNFAIPTACAARTSYFKAVLCIGRSRLRQAKT